MARRVLVNLDLGNNQLLNVILQVLAADPTGIAGKIYYNSTSNTIRFYNGTQWGDLDGGGGGATDHGALTGLGDDDHSQYHTDARALIWLGTRDADDLSAGTTNKYVTQAMLDILGHISVTQAVDLDQMETDIAALANGMVYAGAWDASSGSFPSGADTGAFYRVSVAGTVDGIVFNIGDKLIATTDGASTSTYAGNWDQVDATDEVTSVNSQTGNVVLDASHISETATRKWLTGVQQTLINGLSGKFSATIAGDDSTTSFAVTHNLGNLDIIVNVWDVNSGEMVLVDVDKTSANALNIIFNTAPATGTDYRVVVMG